MRESQTARAYMPFPAHLTGSSYDTREIIIPHDPAAGPLEAVRNVLMQASLAELKSHGLYESYTQAIDPHVLSQLLDASLAPGWIAIDLVHAHYEACDQLALTPEQFKAMGDRVGDRIQNAVLVSLAKKVRDANYDLWQATLPLHRMWARIFQGGSVQVSKLGPRDQLVEERGFTLNRYEYYRNAHVYALTASFKALGANTAVRIASYNPGREEMNVRVTWT